MVNAPGSAINKIAAHALFTGARALFGMKIDAVDMGVMKPGGLWALRHKGLECIMVANRIARRARMSGLEGFDAAVHGVYPEAD
jgi:hypothetical protein